MNAFDPRAVERGVTLSAAIEAATDEEAAGPDGFVRIEASDALWMGLAKGCAAGWHDLGALWFDDGRMHMALWDTGGYAKSHRFDSGAPRRLPLGERPSCAGDAARTRDARPLRRQSHGPARHTRVARSWRLALQAPENGQGIPVSSGGRQRLASDTGGPGACGHHRARPLPVHMQRRDRGAAGGTAGLSAQGHRSALRGGFDRPGRENRRAHLRRQHRCL